MNGLKFMSVSQPQSILIVDDEIIYQIILADALGRYGFCLLTASDGKGALNRAKETRPDLILLDVKKAVTAFARIIGVSKPTQPHKPAKVSIRAIA
jgi:two-component system OmpR family response regulator